MNQVSTSQQSADSKHFIVARYVLRVALMIGVAWIGISTARSIKDWATRENAIAVQPPTIAGDGQLLPVAGSWRFPESQNSRTHLLPLDASASQICGRWSDDDRLLVELVKLETDCDDLVRTWKEAGWEIQHTLWGDSHSFSYLCVKDGTVVYAWSAQSKFITQLMLSSSPDVTVQPPDPTALAAGRHEIVNPPLGPEASADGSQRFEES